MGALLAKPHSAYSNKGKKKFVHEGRMYTKHRDLKGVNKGKVSAECDQRGIGYNGRAWFFEEGQFIKMVTNHGCESNPSHIASTAIRNEEKHLATTTTMRTREILAQVRNQARTSGVQDSLPQVKARKKGIRRARTDSEDFKPPAVPTSLESIIISQSYRIYEAVHGRDTDECLLADSGVDKLNPKAISCDYELAIQNAALGEWEEISVDGCYWHLCSNLCKHLEQEGLSAKYDNDAQFAHECRKIVALACAPIAHLDECFKSLKQHLPVHLSSVLDWFEKYYLGLMQPNGICKTARFPIDSWNLVERIENGENSTNNYAEAYHRKVACELGVRHPTFFKFIDSMKLVQRGVDEAYSVMVVGHDPPIKPKKYRMANERMLSMVKKAVKNWEKIVPIEYLSGIAYNFRMAQDPYLFSTMQEEEFLIMEEMVSEDKQNNSMCQIPANE